MMKLYDTFPNVKGRATAPEGHDAPNGIIEDFNIYDFFGDHWGLFMSHPEDFTPVCTTELAEAAGLYDVFLSMNCKIAALSCDSVESHLKWAEDVNAVAAMAQKGSCPYTSIASTSDKSNLKSGSKRLPFPIIADPTRTVAKSLGLLEPLNEWEKEVLEKAGKPLPLPVTARGCYFIDPKKRVAAVILYPSSTGRNFEEVIRVLKSLQLSEMSPWKVTPVNWKEGDKCIARPILSNDDVKGKADEEKGDSSGTTEAFQAVKLPSGKEYIRFVSNKSNS